MKKNLFYVILFLSICSVSFSATCGVIGVDWTAATLNAAFNGRGYHGMVAYNDGTGEKMWVIGGAAAAYPHLKDVWYSSNGADWSLATGNAAFGELSAFSTFIQGGKVWVVGGDSSGVLKNKVWNSIDMKVWTEAAASSVFSPRTLCAGLLYDAGGGEKMWMIGGATSNANASYINEVWSSADGITWMGTTLNAAFQKRMGLAGVVYNGRMWISGGLATNFGSFNDVWWSTDGVIWNLATANAAFGPRSLHTMSVYDGKMWVVGGVTYADGVVYTDAWWSTDGVTWNLANANTTMGKERATGSCIFNSALYMVGGAVEKDVWYTCGTSIPVPTQTVIATATSIITVTKTITLVPSATKTATVIPSATKTVTLVPSNTETAVPTGTSAVIPATPTVTLTAIEGITEDPTPAITVTDDDTDVYPNPAKDSVKIVFNVNKKADIKIFIYTFNGQFVDTVDYTTGWTPNEKLYQIKLDTAKYAPGMYFYTIQGKDEDGKLINYRSKKFLIKR